MIGDRKYSCFLTAGNQLMEGKPVLQVSSRDKHGNYQNCLYWDISKELRDVAGQIDEYARND